MNHWFKIVLAIFLMIVVACQEKSDSMEIKTGDILFRGSFNGDLSKAINDVTRTGGTNYTHMGIAEVDDTLVWVYHAAPGKGVCRELLSDFQNPEERIRTHVDVYRVNPEFQNRIPLAMQSVKKLVGQAYNYSYIIEDEGYYCSELIYHLWEPDSVFKLEPMTFKRRGSDEFHEGWIKHYRKLEIDIPEGQPGCNPNAMASSKNIYFIKHLQ